jgi:hypothetical protein
MFLTFELYKKKIYRKKATKESILHINETELFHTFLRNVYEVKELKDAFLFGVVSRKKEKNLHYMVMLRITYNIMSSLLISDSKVLVLH